MKLAVVYPVLNQFPIAQTAIRFAQRNISGENEVEIIVLDNASEEPFPEMEGVEIVRFSKNVGVYTTFWESLKNTNADVLAFLHSDLIVCEKGWDKRVLKAFEDNQKLGLVGFIGSNEIDRMGGRGYGTTSNFQGCIYHYSDGGVGVRDHIVSDKLPYWKGSPAGVHGRVSDGFSQAKVVDGCAMIFRRSVLEQIPQRENFPPHHFYDRLLSCEVLERGYEVGVLGIACDHISGQTVCHEQKYMETAKKWCEAHGLGNDDPNTNWDGVIYKEAERQWLSEYRDIKHFIPCRI